MVSPIKSAGRLTLAKARLVVGLTGTFGSGKSTVGKIFRRLGARKVIDADRLVDEAFRPKHPIRKYIQQLFGIHRRASRKLIAKIVFQDPRKRKRLEAIIHPYVFERIRSELKEARSGLIILEIPLLFETGADRFCDAAVAVVSPARAIIKRLLRKSFSSKEVRARLSAQLSQGEKKRRADFFILNSGSKVDLVKRTNLILRKLIFRDIKAKKERKG